MNGTPAQRLEHQDEQHAGFWRQLRTLLWRNYLIKKRLWGTTLAEVLIPVVVMLLMVAIRSAISIENEGINLRRDDIVNFNASTLSMQLAMYPPETAFTGTIQPIAFMPRATVQPLMQRFQQDWPIFANHTVLFDSESEFESYIKNPAYGSRETPYIHFGIVIDSIGTAANNYAWEYTLRVNNSDLTAGGDDGTACYPTSLPETNDINLRYDKLYHTIYMRNGFVWLQDWMDQYILTTSTGVPMSRQLRTVPFPTPPYINDIFADVISGVLGLFFTLVYIWPVTRIIKAIVEEKELRLKEGMRVMGLKESPLWLSWLIMYAFLFLITAVLITIVTGNVFPHSQKGYVFLFFWQFGLCVFAFGYMVSVFFTRARVASTTGALLFLGSFFGYFGVVSASGAVSPNANKMAASVSATICFGLGATTIVKLESVGTGVTAEHASQRVDNFSYNDGAIMFFIDFVLYMLIALYFERVMPNEWGTNLPYTFPFRASFWCPSKQPNAGAGTAASSEEERLKEDYDREHNVEKVDADTKRGLSLRISGLSKEYEAADGTTTKRRAVNNLSLEMYDGQIFSLLGHNGAGKTTLMSILTGMAPATSGQAVINGFNMSDSADVECVRQRFGFCPQHDILYDLLTVKEHLQMFAAIKGVPEEQVEPMVTAMIKDLQLEEKTNTSAFALSGGMKRRLSVGIAMIGGSKILFLDEPTTGMDPFARRATWELLQRNKAGRTIILSTHFMDEADVLGDRIGIMASGNLKCCGSSLFLKNLYGVGYTLTISKQLDEGKPKFDDRAVEDAIKATTKVPAEVLSNIAGEISYRLPFAASRTFADLFEMFDAPNNKLGVAAYGVSVTTLEEVFIRVGHGMSPTPNAALPSTPRSADAKAAEAAPLQTGAVSLEEKARTSGTVVTINIQPAPSAGSDVKMQGMGASAGISTPAPSPMLGVGRDLVSGFRAKTLSGTHFWWRHFTALFIKRFQNAKRDRRVLTWTCLYPVLVALIGIGALTIQPGAQPDLILDTTPLNVVNRVPFESTPSAAAVLNTINDPSFSSLVPVSTNSSEAMSLYLINTLLQYKESRYGAFRYAPGNASTGVYADAVELFYNTTFYHSIPTYYNLINNAVLRSLTGQPAAKITLHVHPMPVTSSQGNLTNSLVAVVFALAFAFITASFVAYQVKEESDKVKHQQLISGVPSFIYWSSSYAWDLVNYLPPALLCFACLPLFGIKETVGENAGATFLCLLLHGFSVIPFAYICSFFFNNHSTAQNTMLIFSFFAGAILLIASIVMRIIESTRKANDVLIFIYRLLPSFCFGESVANLIVRQSPTAYGEPKGIWEMEVVGYPLLYMGLESVIYSLIVLVIEYVRATPALLSYCTSVPVAEADEKRDADDEDVVAEKQRLIKMADSPQRDMISIVGLRKVYPPPRAGMKPHCAVEGLHLGIPEGQCFGYLGVNGAGKTTTLKMLTNDVQPTGGVAFLNNLNILTQQQDVRALLGYCPQFDSLIDNLTAREHLQLYARIKGVPEEDVNLYVEQMIVRLGLQEGIADKPCKEYSGGNKRKLCVGIALIGNPPIVFLDEPSSGMDPVSRRSMWDLISSTMKGRSVILTTHSMEECEALCSRIGIMVNGRLTCLGGAQHLKSRFGADYLVDVSVQDHADRQRMTEFILGTFPGSTVFESHGSSVKYKVLKQQPAGGVSASGAGAVAVASPVAPQVLSFAQIFRLMEANVGRFNVKEYSVSQATLEQIFLLFASKQRPESAQ